MSFAQSIILDMKPPQYPAGERGGGAVEEPREKSPTAKLAPELQILSEQYTPTRGGESSGARDSGIGGYTAQQLREIFGIEQTATDPIVNLVIETNSKTQLEEFRKRGVKIFFRSGNVIYASAPVSALNDLSRAAQITRIGVLKSMNIPQPTDLQTAPTFDFPSRGNEPVALMRNQFNKQGMTGKGVIVGVVDSGIDWTHPDFIRADGTSRVLMLWDVGDNSWRSSAGKIGSAPPIFGEAGEQLPGTIYTNAQINAALKNTAQVKSLDKVGHGTAVAGTAAGNGRGALNGALPAEYQGIAPDADLIVVKVGDCEDSISGLAAIGAYWAAETAKKLKRPAVINISLGSHYTAHDGSSDEEQLLDKISDPVGGFGIPVVVAAGNEGRLSLHAGGRFGARQPEQIDIASQPIEANVDQPSQLLATFAQADDWGITFRSTNRVFLGTNGKPAVIYLSKAAERIKIETDQPLADNEQFRAFLSTVRLTNHGATDSLMMQLVGGKYFFFGYGASANVKNGQFDLYLPSQEGASFGLGTEKRFMVASPGNSTKAITVGSIDFRSNWENSAGQISRFNLRDGEVSDYSSPGPRRDGITKPEIVAPGRYTIASLSKFSIPENGGCKASMVASAAQRKTFVTKSSNHLAWSGTSAATPFVTGVIALMLQKNPNLKPEQIKQILIKTATGRTANGQAVNNERLGFGIIAPEAAIKAALPISRVKK